MTFAVVIPSKNPENCVACVRALEEREPDLPPHHIVVVDDGARLRAEAELALGTVSGDKVEYDLTRHHDLRSGHTWLTGEKPFVFARNMNLGIRHAFDDLKVDGVILLNDDARLLTPSGFRILQTVAENAEGLMLIDGPMGLCSPTFTDAVGNRNQLSKIFRGADRVEMLRPEPRILAFVCVYLPRATWDAVGPLDEGFDESYGWEDNDYCRRTLATGRQLIISEYCLVEHGQLPSTFRTGNEARSIINANARHYYDKHGDLEGLPIPVTWQGEDPVDLLKAALAANC